MKEIKNFVVLGAGAMGAQIGALAASPVSMSSSAISKKNIIQRGRQIIEGNYDKRIQRGRFTEEAKKQVLSRITFVTDLKEAVKDADYVIEAVPEILSLKQKVFGEASAISPAGCGFRHQYLLLEHHRNCQRLETSRTVGRYPFLQSARHVLVLLEIIQGEKTSSETIAIADVVAKKMGREIVHVKDGPGLPGQPHLG